TQTPDFAALKTPKTPSDDGDDRDHNVHSQQLDYGVDRPQDWNSSDHLPHNSGSVSASIQASTLPKTPDSNDDIQVNYIAGTEASKTLPSPHDDADLNTSANNIKTEKSFDTSKPEASSLSSACTITIIHPAIVHPTVAAPNIPLPPLTIPPPIQFPSTISFPKTQVHKTPTSDDTKPETNPPLSTSFNIASSTTSIKTCTNDNTPPSDEETELNNSSTRQKSTSHNSDSIGSNENNKKKSSNEKKKIGKRVKTIGQRQLQKKNFQNTIKQFILNCPLGISISFPGKVDRRSDLKVLAQHIHVPLLGIAKFGLLFCNSGQERCAVFLSKKIFFKAADQRIIPSIAWDNQNETNTNFERSKKFFLGNCFKEENEIKSYIEHTIQTGFVEVLLFGLLKISVSFLV
ncbi:late embryogenesis abundant protein, partial [Reticulomyxa filosa]